MGGECAEKIHLILRADLVVGVEHQLLRMGREGISESQNRVVWGGSVCGEIIGKVGSWRGMESMDASICKQIRKSISKLL